MSRATEESRASRVLVGQRIRAAREQKKVTQVQLSQRTGIPQPTISAIESGERQGATPGQIALIAGALEVSTDQLLPPQVLPKPAAPVSPWQRKLEASKEAFIKRFTELGHDDPSHLEEEDVLHVRAVAFLVAPGIEPDDEWWWDIVESGRRRRERARSRGGSRPPSS